MKYQTKQKQRQGNEGFFKYSSIGLHEMHSVYFSIKRINSSMISEQLHQSKGALFMVGKL